MRRLDYPTVSRLLCRSMGTTLAELEDAFRPAKAADLPSILELRANHNKIEHREDDHAYLTWRYQFEPEGWRNQLWVFQWGGEIVGLVGVEREYLTYRRIKRDVFKLMDILLREDHMLTGLGVWINLRLRHFFENTYCIGSTRYSHSIVTKLNQSLPPWQTWRYPIRLQQFRGHTFGVRGLNALLRVRDFFKPRKIPKGYQLDISDSPDPAIDELYRSMTNLFLMPRRSLDKYGWRFGKHPTLKARYFRLRTGGQLVTQAAVTPAPNRRANVYDLLFRDRGDSAENTRNLSVLMASVINTLAAEGIDVVSAQVNDPVSAAGLSRAGFILRNEPGPIGYTFHDEELDAIVRQGVPFFLTPADADYD
jgi:hypothetical protein